MRAVMVVCAIEIISFLYSLCIYYNRIVCK